MQEKIKRQLRKMAVLLFWIGIWYLAACLVNNRLLLVSPWRAFEKTMQLLGSKHFYPVVWHTMVRIIGGFAVGTMLGLLLAFISYRVTVVEELFAPAFAFLKTVPVASIVVLLLIWWGAENLAVAVCVMIVLPNIYINVLEGLKSTPKEMLEMAEIFHFSGETKLYYIYLQNLYPFLMGSLKVSLGMCWKAGVAAELIGTPKESIGESLYLAKIYMDTADIFAWTLVVILLSYGFEKLILFLVELVLKHEPKVKGFDKKSNHGTEKGLQLVKVSKAFGEKIVLQDVDKCFEEGRTYYLQEPSGSGKTTLLRIIAGLEKADSGEVDHRNCSMMFQEDRLCENFDPYRNLELVTGDRQAAVRAIESLFTEEASELQKSCNQLSGGMKRRVALARAMEADSEVVLLDEPFTGMDKETRMLAEKYIQDRKRGRIVIIASHI